jgi:hypothetical protein
MLSWRRFAGTLAAFIAAVALLAFAAPTSAQERVGEFTMFGPFALPDSSNGVATLFDPLGDGRIRAEASLRRSSSPR